MYYFNFPEKTNEEKKQCAKEHGANNDFNNAAEVCLTLDKGAPQSDIENCRQWMETNKRTALKILNACCKSTKNMFIYWEKSY